MSLSDRCFIIALLAQEKHSVNIHRATTENNVSNASICFSWEAFRACVGAVGSAQWYDVYAWDQFPRVGSGKLNLVQHLETEEVNIYIQPE